MLVQLVRMRTTPQHRAAFLTAAEANIRGSRQEPGCLRFDLLAAPDDDCTFHALEIFADQAALDAHRATPHYRAFVAAIAPLTLDRGRKIPLATLDMDPRPLPGRT